MDVRFCDEFEGGVGWIHPEPGFMQRCAHALAVEGRVWLVDAIDGEGVGVRVRALGEPAGVIQLVDRHGRDCAALAERYGVPHIVLPLDPVEGAPFRFLEVRKGRTWREVALWWPERRVLVCGDALGTARYYRAGDERLAVHPLLRPIPPRRRLGVVAPERVLCGHGEGIHERADEPFREALRTARRRLPAWIATGVRGHAFRGRRG